MAYAKSFFELQLQFSHKVVELTGLPIERVLLEYTNFYIRFGLGRGFDPADATWQTYLAGLGKPGERADSTYRFYLKRADAMAGPSVVATFGCFSYATRGSDRSKLHFQNAETEDHSPLGVERQEQRRADLAELFGHVQQTHPERETVIGASWLYNIEAYRRLFPASYLATTRPAGPLFQRMPLWGQFVDRHGDTRSSMTRSFLKLVEQQSRLDHLIDCFPFQALVVEAPVVEFHDFFGICPNWT